MMKFDNFAMLSTERIAQLQRAAVAPLSDAQLRRFIAHTQHAPDKLLLSDIWYCHKGRFSIMAYMSEDDLTAWQTAALSFGDTIPIAWCTVYHMMDKATKHAGSITAGLLFDVSKQEDFIRVVQDVMAERAKLACEADAERDTPRSVEGASGSTANPEETGDTCANEHAAV
jgi:hypothetical protein